MCVKLLTEHYLDFLSLKGVGTGLSESTHVKMQHCWKSHATAQLYDRPWEIRYKIKTKQKYDGIRFNLLQPFKCQICLFVSIYTSQSTKFQLYQDGSLWVEPVLSRAARVRNHSISCQALYH